MLFQMVFYTEKKFYFEIYEHLFCAKVVVSCGFC